MTGVEVTPISGVTWPQPCVSLNVSPAASSVTCHRSERRLREILTSAAQIVLVREHIGSGGCNSARDGQRRAAAGGAAASIGDDDGENAAAVARRRDRRRIGWRRGAGDGRCVSLPPIGQGRGPRGAHREGGGLARRHLLIRGL